MTEIGKVDAIQLKATELQQAVPTSRDFIVNAGVPALATMVAQHYFGLTPEHAVGIAGLSSMLVSVFRDIGSKTERTGAQVVLRALINGASAGGAVAASNIPEVNAAILRYSSPIESAVSTEVKHMATNIANAIQDAPRFALEQLTKAGSYVLENLKEKKEAYDHVQRTVATQVPAHNPQLATRHIAETQAPGWQQWARDFLGPALTIGFVDAGLLAWRPWSVKPTPSIS
ncbi:MAG: hypothetical protein AAB508_06870 [Patescibacteria group bacterium]